MTDQQTGLRHDGHDADELPWAGYAEPLDDTFDAWDGDEWDGDTGDVDTWGRPAAPAQPARPWFRDPRWLFGLIGLAAAALVVATVLLLTGRGSGEIPTAPELTTRTPAGTTSVPSPRTAPPSASASPTTSASASSSSEEPGPVDIPEPAQPAPSATEAPSESAAANQSKSPAGPRINVTRTPMSFSPGKH